MGIPRIFSIPRRRGSITDRLLTPGPRPGDPHAIPDTAMVSRGCPTLPGFFLLETFLVFPEVSISLQTEPRMYQKYDQC